MSKLKDALIPGYGANPTKPTSNPLKGLAPNLETGLPVGLPSGIGKAALRASNPVGGIGPDVNGDIGYQKGWLDQSSNGTPDPGPKAPGYNVWADPDITKRGWGWGMGADGALHTGVQGGGPNGTKWGIPGTTTANGGGYGPGNGVSNTPIDTRAPGANTGVASPSAISMSPDQGAQLAQRMRGMAMGGGQGGGMAMGQGAPMGGGQGMPPMPQQGPGMGPGGPQSMPPMGGQSPTMPQAMPQAGQAPPWAQGMTGGGGAQNPQAIAQLIAQMRMQQGQPQPGMPGTQ